MIAIKADKIDFEQQLLTQPDFSEDLQDTEPVNQDIADKSFQKVKRSDKTLRFMTAQIVLCALTLLIVLALKMFGGGYYTYAREVFRECFDEPINKAQVLGENEARAVVAAQSTVYGMGGESADNSVNHIDDKSKLSAEQQQALSTVNRMMMPVNSTTVTCEYGWRIHPITGKRSFHTGIDIGEDMGKNIYAVLDGTVKKTVENDADYGNYVIITHSSGVETMYAHCDSLCVKAGQNVSKGDVIAYVGTTGLSTGPHLHFEVRINDTRLNPRWFINIGDK